MLGRNYIKINGNKIPNPTNLTISNQNIENVKQAEAGNDVGNVTKLCKRMFQFSFTSTSGGKAKIKAFCMLASCTMSFNGEDIVGRLRLKSENLIQDSEYFDRTAGLWKLTVTFSENGE